MKNLERLEELGFELSILFYFDIFAIEPNFFIGCLAARLYALIVSSLLQFLSVEQVLLAN